MRSCAHRACRENNPPAQWRFDNEMLPARPHRYLQAFQNQDVFPRLIYLALVNRSDTVRASSSFRHATGLSGRGGPLFAQLFQGASDFSNSSDHSNIIVPLFITLAVLLGWWRWSKMAFESDSSSHRARPARRWVLRPSNFLFVLAFGLIFYLAYQSQPFASVRWLKYPGGIFCLAFLLRRSENKAIMTHDV